MPSFTSILAFGLLGASAWAQSNLGAVEADLVARDDMSSDNLFARSDLEARWGKHENFGAKCHAGSECRTNVHMSKAFCDHTHHCNFHCLGDTWKVTKGGYHCVGKYEAKKCHYHHSCKTDVEHAWGYCNNGKCAHKCAPGYTPWGKKCIKAEKYVSCGGKKCPPVEGGSTTCSKWHGKETCSQHCDSHLGEKLYTNKNKTAYRCINTGNDANNCGKPNHVCPKGYHGKGSPYCYDGKCQLNCHGYRVKYTHSNVPYCSTQKI